MATAGGAWMTIGKIWSDPELDYMIFKGKNRVTFTELNLLELFIFSG